MSAGYLIGCKAPSSYYAGPLSASPRLEEVSADLRGLVVGWEECKDKAPFVEARWSSDSSVDLEFLEVLVGLRQYFTRQGGLYLGGRVDLGFANAELSSYPNENTLLSLGGGVFGELALRPSVSLFSFVGGRYYLDITSPTTCNDGSTSNSTGSGTCSHHGGIDHYNAHIGDGAGIEFSVGLKVQF